MLSMYLFISLFFLSYSDGPPPVEDLKFWAIPRLFERLFLISWENNRDCHITMPLSLKSVELQIKGDQ